MIHHYLQKGWKLNDFMELSLFEKQFMMASMDLFVEEETQKLKALVGGG